MAEQHPGRDSLLGFLRANKDQSDQGLFDKKKIREDWVLAVRSLMATLREYLRPAEEAGLLKVHETEIPIREEQLGDYTVPGLHIVAPSERAVDVLPRARIILGGLGRVDIGSGPKTAMLILDPLGAWSFQWKTPGPRGWDSVPLNEDTFSENLQNLLS